MTPQPTCYCGNPIPADGPSDLYCSPECQTRWLQKGHDYLPIPARPEWRMGASESDWRRSMAWPDVPALPPQGVEQWIEDTDPSPVAEPPEPGHEKARPLNREPGGVSIQPTAALGFTEFGQRVEPSPGVMRRILNATRRNT